MRNIAIAVLVAAIFSMVMPTASDAQLFGEPVKVRRPAKKAAVQRRKSNTAPITDNIVAVLEEASPHADENDTNDSMAGLAEAYWASGLQRVLSVRGLGPLANARELMHLRGIDMAVVNSDVTAYAKVTGELPGLAERIRMILRLYDKTIVIIALGDVKSLQDLAGQRILAQGADSDSHVSARALFGLLNIPVAIGDADFNDAVLQVINGQAKALVTLVEHDDESLGKLPAGKGLHVVAVPMTDQLAGFYAPTAAPVEKAPGLGPDSKVPTVEVSSVIATFDWKPAHDRYFGVVQFARNLPQAIARLRKEGKGHVWKEIDGSKDVRGWTRFEPGIAANAQILPETSEPEKVQVPAAVAEKVVKPEPAPPQVVRSTSAGLTSARLAIVKAEVVPDLETKSTTPLAKTIEPSSNDIEIAARPVSGLANPSAEGGGMLLQLVTASLGSLPNHVAWTQSPDVEVQNSALWSGTRVGLGWTHPNCGARDSLPARDRDLCDGFVFSQPLFRALQVFFVRQGSDFAFERDDQVAGHVVCSPAGMDVSALDSPSRSWLKQSMITLLRKPDLGACLKALDHGDADAVFADDLPGRESLEKLGLADKIETVGRPVAMLSISAIAAKSNPQATGIIARIDAGLAAMKSDGRYADIVQSQMRHPVSVGDKQAKQ